MTCLPDVSLADRLTARKQEQRAALSTSRTAPATDFPAGSGATSAPSASAEPSSEPAEKGKRRVHARCVVRVCRVCGESKPLDGAHFNTNGFSRSGERWFKRTCKICYRAANKAYKEEIRQDPVRRQREWMANRAHSQRKTERRRRARRLAAAGLDLPPEPTRVDDPHSLPSLPLAEAVDRARVSWGFSSMEDLCERLQVAPRTVMRWRNGDLPTVGFDLADRVLTRLDLLWFDVWEECPGDARHHHDVATTGECARCEAHCDAEDAFTASALRADRLRLAA
jgi:hypothetical protein